MNFATAYERPVRYCGRPTKTAGTPCRHTIGICEVACKAHTTQADASTHQLLEQAYEGGLADGRFLGREEVEMEVQRARLQVEREEVEAATRRIVAARQFPVEVGS